MSGHLLISLARELSEYLKDHPSEIPGGIDLKKTKVVSEPFRIDDIEMYTNGAYDNTFGWRFGFKSSSEPDKSYLYKIHYRAYFQGECGIVSAQLIHLD